MSTQEASGGESSPPEANVGNYSWFEATRQGPALMRGFLIDEDDDLSTGAMQQRRAPLPIRTKRQVPSPTRMTQHDPAQWPTMATQQGPAPMRGFLIDEDDNLSTPATWQGQVPMRGFLIDEDDDSPYVGGVDQQVLEVPATSPDMDAPQDPEALPHMLSSTALPQGRSDSGKNVLRLVALLLPGDERSEWLEEQRGYLADMPSRRARWTWIAAQLLAMPRYAYAVRTGSETEPA
ncbi:hypothetical protein [Streptomyces sp. Ag109_G2-15]|uniref:hypothetical protein n=1 Tax=Streptomyces sp. Ag109_G2-15 TaxID=1938850 RepID=UPI000BD4E3FC|nr:hypothetical protein [Streptomyces sp. Ag109_G2-15]SOD87653.1 hypothetical protein SAMN06272765_5144 [Streptomyces sp. Ag109_G2-15]